MRSTILTLSALLGLSLCVMLEVSAEKPDSNQASINTPVTLSKRGGKKHKGGKGHGGKHHHGKGGSGKSESGKSEGGGDSSKGDDIFGTVSKAIIEKLPDNVNHAISGLKLPTGAIVFGITLTWFQVVAVKVNHVNSARLNKRKLNVHKRQDLLGLGNIFSQSGAQTSGSPVNMFQTPGFPAGTAPPGGAPAPAPAPAPGGGGGGAPDSAPAPAPGGGGSPPPPGGGFPTIPTVAVPPLPIPAAPGLPVSFPTIPGLTSFPPLPALPPLPGSDEIQWPSLDLLAPKED